MNPKFEKIRIPAEWEPHACCWMAWAPRRGWGASLNKVKQELSSAIRAIAAYEPVKVLAPKGVLLREARGEFDEHSNIEVIEAPVDDIWMRDIAPTFALGQLRGKHEIVAIDWNFNGWGGSETVIRGDMRPADVISDIADVTCIRANFSAEGGALIFDGQGTAITTRSCLLNPNRNPVKSGFDRQQWISDDLRRFGIERTIWLEGDPSETVTSGHVDGYVLLAPDGRALVEVIDDDDAEGPMWRDHDVDVLRSLRSEQRQGYRIKTIAAPRHRYWKQRSEDFAPCYLNAYVANGAVIGAKFGDPERDLAARRALEGAFPKRDVVLLDINHLAEGGGGVHCLTQPMSIVQQ
jgi:agmatine deiminase